MKQTIIIMKNSPELSDDEIRRYMNFDQLLAARNTKVKAARRSLAIKIAVPLLLASAFSVWYFVNHRNTPAREDANNTRTLTSPGNVPDVTVPDSVKVATNSIPETSETPVPRKKPVVKTKPSEAEPVKIAPRASDEYIQAEPMEGYASLYHYLNTELHYPTESLKDSIQGVETVSFTISTDGKPGNIVIVESLGESFDTEARRLIENMPAWKPAILNGIPVESKMSIPLTFQIRTTAKP
jgi:TonB family protein